MQRDFYYRAEKVLSPGRLAVYRQSGMDPFDVLANYLWNIQLSEALYPSLHILEVGLRNCLHDALSFATSRADWYDIQPPFLQPRESALVLEAKQYLVKQKKVIDPDRVVAELNFGFWISFLYARYSRLWPKIAERAVPHMPRRARTQANVLKKLGAIRDLRNRVFHHERIIHRPLTQLHRDIFEAIAWVSPQLLHMAKAIDRFGPVMTARWGQSRRQLMDFSYPSDYQI